MQLTNHDLKTLWVSQLLDGMVVDVRFHNGRGQVYLDGDNFVFRVTSGWAAGMTEAICHRDSAYIRTFLNGAISISANH